MPVIATRPCGGWYRSDQFVDEGGEELDVAVKVPLVSAPEGPDRLGERYRRPRRLGEGRQPAHQCLVIGARPAPVQADHEPRRRALRLGQQVAAGQAGDPYRAGARGHVEPGRHNG